MPRKCQCKFGCDFAVESGSLEAGTGAIAESDLTVEATELNLALGESAQLTISGYIPEKPAVYCSNLRVTPCEGPQLAIRVEFRVAARAAWGFACMVFGLSLVGLINVLDSESGVKGQLSRALAARQSAQEFFQENTPPQNSTTQVENLYHKFDSAISILQKPRDLSFVDHRGTDADEHLKSAVEQTSSLRAALSKKPGGSVEVADVDNEWADLRKNFTSLSKQFNFTSLSK